MKKAKRMTTVVPNTTGAKVVRFCLKTEAAELATATIDDVDCWVEPIVAFKVDVVPRPNAEEDEEMVTAWPVVMSLQETDYVLYPQAEGSTDVVVDGLRDGVTYFSIDAVKEGWLERERWEHEQRAKPVKAKVV